MSKPVNHCAHCASLGCVPWLVRRVRCKHATAEGGG